MRDSTGSKGLQGNDQGQRHTVTHTMRPSLSVPAVPAASRLAQVAGVFVCTRESLCVCCVDIHRIYLSCISLLNKRNTIHTRIGRCEVRRSSPCHEYYQDKRPIRKQETGLPGLRPQTLERHLQSVVLARPPSCLSCGIRPSWFLPPILGYNACRTRRVKE